MDPRETKVIRTMQMILDKVGFPLYETETNKSHIKYLREQEDVVGGITLHNANYNMKVQKSEVRSTDNSPLTARETDSHL